MSRLKKIVKICAWSVFGVIALFFIFFAPVNDKPLDKSSFYRKNLEAVETAQVSIYKTKKDLKVAWGEINITPNEFIPMAGYRPRSAFETVHDSLFAKIFIIENEEAKIAMVTLDLLLFPPALKDKLIEKQKQLGISHYYFSATHTHNGFGCWNNTLAGEFIAGTYSEALIDTLANGIVRKIRSIKKDVKSTRILYSETNADELVINRINDSAAVDGTIRALQFVRVDSSKALLLTFSGHPTSISKKSLALSADYPAIIVREMKNDGFDFTMFMAGMVGSHRIRDNGLSDFDLVEKIGQAIAKKIHHANWLPQKDSTHLNFASVKLQFGEPQLRVASQIKLRSWLFNAALYPLQGEIQLLSIGNINFISTPCDFSGEVFVKNIKPQISQPVIITSFNGDYIGYITYDKHYNASKKEEVRAMNWVGPYHGKMFSELIVNLLLKKEENNE